MSWCFSFWVKAKGGQLNAEGAELALATSDADGESVVLKSREREAGLADATELAVLGTGYATGVEAASAGDRWVSLAMRTFAAVRFAADLGYGAPSGWISPEVLADLSAKSGRPAINYARGVMVYEAARPPIVATISGGGIRVVVSDRLSAALTDARAAPLLSDRERLAYDLFSGSFFAGLADSRFMLLMMAVETLAIQEARSPAVLEAIDSLAEVVAHSKLSDGERQSLRSGLRDLRRESVNAAGRRLAATLVGCSYQGDDPQRFFSHCYDLRNKMVHGEFPRPSLDEIDRRAAGLEVFVGDLLSGRFAHLFT